MCDWKNIYLLCPKLQPIALQVYAFYKLLWNILKKHIIGVAIVIFFLFEAAIIL